MHYNLQLLSGQMRPEYLFHCKKNSCLNASQYFYILHVNFSLLCPCMRTQELQHSQTTPLCPQINDQLIFSHTRNKGRITENLTFLKASLLQLLQFQ